MTVVVALGVAVLPITAVGSADLYGISAIATGLPSSRAGSKPVAMSRP